MKKIIISVVVMLIVICSPGSSYGQEDSTKTFSMDEKIALTFQIESSFRLSSFEGQMISIKKMIGEGQALRLGLGLYGSHLEGEDLSYPGYKVIQDDESRLNLNFSFSMLNYVNRDDEIRAYYGYGLRTIYQHYWAFPGYEETIQVGPIGYVGVEWFVKERISLSGEYGSFLYYSYSWNKSYVSILNKEITTNDHKIGISQDNVKLGVSVYF